MLQGFWRTLTRRPADLEAQSDSGFESPGGFPDLTFADDDPLAAHFVRSPTAVLVDRLELDSPALRAMKQAGVHLAVPLVSQGELVGVLQLGPRRSEQEYSAEDRALLDNLAAQAAPALRVAQLVLEQRQEAEAHERLAHELRVARLIQQTLLPRTLPDRPGWKLAALYRPARAVGGDFYDVLELRDGRLGLLIGDVTDKGVPAALVMASARSILRTAALQASSPGEVLARANQALCPDIPPDMFVTCLYAILDPATGELTYANAGHPAALVRGRQGVEELRVAGLPLGLMAEARYEERSAAVRPAETVLFYSDGLIEAHSRTREMFGARRLRALLADHSGGTSLIEFLIDRLTVFTSPGWEQEDDVTLVVLERVPTPARARRDRSLRGGDWRELAAFELPSEPGRERQALARVAEVAGPLLASPTLLERLKTAVAEATMNAIEHGNLNRPELPVALRVLSGPNALAVHISDRGSKGPMPEPHTPDLEAKLAGRQPPRGWGLFLIESMVDEMNVQSEPGRHTVELIMYLKESDHDRARA